MNTFTWTELDAKAVDTARVLAADAVEKVGNGHPGAAISLAPVAHVLFQKVMIGQNVVVDVEHDLPFAQPDAVIAGGRQSRVGLISIGKAIGHVQGLRHFVGAVGGAVIDQNHFVSVWMDGLVRQAFEDEFEGLFAVAAAEAHGDFAIDRTGHSLGFHFGGLSQDCSPFVLRCARPLRRYSRSAKSEVARGASRPSGFFDK